ncbi:MAG: histidine kinase [Chitinophagales bacterium]
MMDFSPSPFKNLLSKCLFVILIGSFWTACTKKQAPNPVRNLSYTQDSIRLVHAIDSIFDIQFDYPDSAFQAWQPFAQEALKKKIYLPLMSYYRYGVFNRAALAQDLETATELAQSSMTIAKLTNDSTFLGHANYNIAILYGAQDILDSASYYFLRSIDYLASGQDWGAELDAWTNLAEMTKMQGDLLTAEKYKLAVLNRTRMRKDKREMGFMYLSLVDLYIEMDKLPQSRQYLDSATYVLQVFDDTLNTNLLEMKGRHALAQSNFDRALFYFHLLQEKSIVNQDISSFTRTLFKLAFTHSQLNNPDSARYYLRLFEENSGPQQLSKEQQLKYAETKFKLKDVNTSTKETIDNLTTINRLLNEKIEQNKNLFGTKRLHQIEQAEKDKIILQQTVQNQNKNLTITWLIVGLAAMLIAILFTLFYLKKRRQLHRQELLILEQQREFELKSALLKSQLKERNRISQELHDDLGATLTSISMSAELLKRKHPELNSREVEIIADSSSSLVDSMNEIVWSLNSNNDSLQSLVAYIRKFTSQFLTDADISFSIDSLDVIPNIELEGAVRRSIFLTAKEALNNIVKHAQASHVNLRFAIESDVFMVQIEDNGKGFVVSENTDILGNGLRNMKHNMENINGEMTYFSNPKSTKITLLFPLKKDKI